MLVTDPKQVAVLTHPARRAVMERLVNGMSGSREIAESMKISQQLVYHHLRTLQKAGLVQVVERINRANGVERFRWGAVDTVFQFQVPEIRRREP